MPAPTSMPIKEVTQTTTVADLSYDNLRHIFSFLTDKELNQAGLVNQNWQAVARDIHNEQFKKKYFKDLNEEERLFFNAVIKDDVQTVEQLLNSNAGLAKKRILVILNKNWKGKCDPLLLAAIMGSYNVTCWLLEKQDKLPITFALQLAAKHGHLQIAEVLVQKLYSFDTKVDDVTAYNDALCFAASKGALALVDKLLKLGSSIHNNHRPKGIFEPKPMQFFRASPIFYAAKFGHLEVVKKLIKKGANDPWALQVAAESGHAAVVNVLLKLNADIIPAKNFDYDHEVAEVLNQHLQNRKRKKYWRNFISYLLLGIIYFIFGHGSLVLLGQAILSTTSIWAILITAIFALGAVIISVCGCVGLYEEFCGKVKAQEKNSFYQAKESLQAITPITNAIAAADEESLLPLQPAAADKFTLLSRLLDNTTLEVPKPVPSAASNHEQIVNNLYLDSLT